MRALLTLKSAQVILAAILGSFLLVACGSSSSTSSQPNKPAQQPATIPTNGAAYPALAMANTNVLLNATTSQSLVNIVKAAGKQVGVFEFVGVTCGSCKIESPQAAAQLAPYADRVTRLVVFPNGANEYSAAEYQGFINSYSQGARYAVDSDFSLLNSVRADAKQFFGIFVIVKSDGTGVVLNQGDALSRMLPAVQAALNGK